MTDAELAQALIKLNGGCSPIAAALGCRVQRVFNWTTRGIPARVQLQRPDLFGPHRVMEAMRSHEPRETPAVITAAHKPNKDRAAASDAPDAQPDRREVSDRRKWDRGHTERRRPERAEG